MATERAGQTERMILEALPFGAGVVDGAGLLVATNAAWRAHSSAQPGERFEEACRRDGMSPLAAGVAEILADRRDAFELERPGTEPGAVVLAAATPIGPSAAGGALVRFEPVDRPQSGPLGALARSLFRDLADSSTFLIWLSNDTGATTFVNRAWLELTGRALQEEIGDGWIESVHPDDRRRCQETYHRHFEARAPYEIEYRLRRADGEYAWVLSRAAPRHDPRGRFIGYIGTALDVTGMRRAEEGYKGIFDAMRDGIIVLDETGRVVDANPAACAMHGYSREEFVGLNPRRFIVESSIPEFERFVDSVRAGETFNCVAVDRRKDGSTFEIEVHGTRLMHHGRTHLIGIVRDISRQRRTELELRSLGESMEALLRNLPLILYRIDAGGRFVESFGAGLATLGLADGEMVGANVFEEFANVADTVRRAIAGETLAYEAQGEFRGRYWCYQTFMTPDHRTGSGIVGFSLDVTERKLAERALAESEQRLRDVAEQVPGVVYSYETEPDGTRRILYIGPGLEGLLGPGLARRVHDDPNVFFERMTPDGRARVRAAAEQSLRTGRPMDLEYELIAEDGRRVWVRNLVRVVVDERGVGRSTGVIIDAVEKHAAELALMESRELLDSTQKIGRIGGWKLDIDRDALSWTEEVYRILGLQPDAEPSFELLLAQCGEADATLLRRALDQAIAGAEPWDLELRLRHDDRPDVRVRVTGECQREHGRAIALWGIIQDITRQRELEEELRHAQKMEAVGQLAAGAAHEFNNLISAISGQVDIARAAIRGRGLADEALGRIAEAMDQAFGLARSLLAFARKSEPIRETIEVAGVLEQVERLLNRSLPRRITRRIDPTGGEGSWILADAPLIQHVVINLAINARDAMPEGGTLTIDAKECERDGSPGITIRVADTGTGIEERVQRHMFEPFFTTKGPERGTGLGLAFSRSIVEDHAGELRAESEPGQGSTFTIWLPTVDPPADVRDLAPPLATAVLFESHPFTRSVLTTLLDEAGYRVRRADTLADALERAPAGNLAVLSLHEGDAAVRDLVDRLAAAAHRAGIVLIVGATSVGPDALPPNVAVVERPFRASDLTAAIGRVAPSSNGVQ